MKTRVVLHGHASYDQKDGYCILPKGTTICFYAPLGALLDQAISTALANQEDVKSDDIEPIRDFPYFVNCGLVPPKEVAILSKEDVYPRVYKEGDKVPNFYIKPAEVIQPDIKPLNLQPSKVVTVEKKTQLSDLLKTYHGENLHWAACCYVKHPDHESIGYGYAYKFKKSSKLKALYAPELSESQKRERRAKKFGIPFLDLDPARINAATGSVSANSNIQFSQNNKDSKDYKIVRHNRSHQSHRYGPYRR